MLERLPLRLKVPIGGLFRAVHFDFAVTVTVAHRYSAAGAVALAAFRAKPLHVAFTAHTARRRFRHTATAAADRDRLRVRSHSGCRRRRRLRHGFRIDLGAGSGGFDALQG